MKKKKKQEYERKGDKQREERFFELEWLKKEEEKSETQSEKCNRKDRMNKVKSIFVASIELSFSSSNLPSWITLSS